MVRVTNYFDTQVRVPSGEDMNEHGQHIYQSKSDKGLFDTNFDQFTHLQQEATTRKRMTDQQIIGWYSKILDSVRLRYRKLQRFARQVRVVEFAL
jgi:mitogen-activated protein kinase kinase kinase